ncbi:MAG TPA: murein biosynthesis integral membrane protein MurJ [Actinomycetota bacterium]|nr:murein biosynthesis integral membrane protein MurJ [Actinomycetota bacterium]
MTSLARASAVMTVGTVLSRATGLARLAAIAAALGVAESRLPDAYNLANTAPNIIYELVLGGILTSVFVPVFVELLEKEGRERAWQVGSALINISMVVLVAITALGVLAAPLIARFYTLTVEGPEAVMQQRVLTFLLRLFLPQIIFYGLAAITAGLLNAHKRFGAPMYTPVLNNLAVVAVFVAFHQAYQEDVSLQGVTDRQLWIIGLGTTGGVALMALAQLPFLRGLGRYRPTLSLRHPSVKKLARLSLFVIGYVIVNQIGYLIVQVLANDQQGGYSAYISAFTFFLLPHGLFAVSLITALLPGMSQHAINERWDAFRERLSVGIRATFLLIIPAAVGYLVLSDRVVRLLLERGVFSETSTELVSGVLRFFVLGLVSFSLFQLFLRAFYALQDTRTPFFINCVAVGVNTALNFPLYLWLGVRGLAAGHAIAYTAGATLQIRILGRRIGGLDGARIRRSLARMLAAGVGMGALTWLSSEALGAWWGNETLEQQLVGVAVPVGVGIASYLGLAYRFGVSELQMVRGIVTRRTTVQTNDEEADDR